MRLKYLISSVYLLISTCTLASTIEYKKDISGDNNLWYSNDEKGFFIYPHHKKRINEYDIFDNSISPSGKYILTQRISKGILVNEDGEEIIVEKNLCDLIDLNTGCVLSYYDGEVCGSNWTEDNKIETSYGDITISLSKEVIKPKQQVDALKYNVMPFYMSAESYMSCHPVNNNNYRNYNDIGYYLSTKYGRDEEAISIYKEVEKLHPNRTVLMLNIADSYWKLGDLDLAKIYYKKYIKRMQEINKEKRIPKFVFKRIN